MKLIPFIIATGIVVSNAAFAEHNVAYDYASVIDAKPLTHTVRVSTPRRECSLEQVAHRQRGYRSATPQILGSVVGGLLGHRLGHNKHARAAGSVAGVILGGSIGRDIGNNIHTQPLHYTTEEVCHTYQDYHDEERITGYHVTYKYRGNTYTTEMPNHPGDRIKIKISVTPLIDFDEPAHYSY